MEDGSSRNVDEIDIGRDILINSSIDAKIKGFMDKGV
jgi:hypothetical protein